MTTSRTALRFTRWDLETLRAGKAVRDEVGEAIPELDAMLAMAEQQFTAGTFDRDVEHQLAEEMTTPRRSNPSGASSYGTRNAASDAQLRFIAKLAADLGYELQAPRDKSHASLIIDAAKKELARRAAQGITPARAPRPATDGQRAYLADLLATRQHTLGEVDVEAVTFDAARTMIDALTAAPRVKNATAAHGIREGSYAFQPAEGPAAFYRVSRTGRIYVQAGPAEHPYRGQLNEALTWIAGNAKDAAALYGRLIGVCGRCGRELTDETSRALGLGPVCADKGW